jgi:hypothetical protein
VNFLPYRRYFIVRRAEELVDCMEIDYRSQHTVLWALTFCVEISLESLGNANLWMKVDEKFNYCQKKKRKKKKNFDLVDEAALLPSRRRHADASDTCKNMLLIS